MILHKYPCKYDIDHFISLMPQDIYKKDVIAKLNEFGISTEQYIRDKSIPQKDKAIVPDERLAIYANVLGVSIEKLKNYPPEKEKLRRTTKRARHKGKKP